MINYEKNKYYRMWANNDKSTFGPFEEVRLKGNFVGEEFSIPKIDKLKSRKNCAGKWAGKVFVFEDEDEGLKCKEII